MQPRLNEKIFEGVQMVGMISRHALGRQRTLP